MRKAFLSWLSSSKAATAIEYGLIAAAIAVAISAIVFSTGESIETNLQTLTDKVSSEPL